MSEAMMALLLGLVLGAATGTAIVIAMFAKAAFAGCV